MPDQSLLSLVVRLYTWQRRVEQYRRSHLFSRTDSTDVSYPDGSNSVITSVSMYFSRSSGVYQGFFSKL